MKKILLVANIFVFLGLFSISNITYAATLNVGPNETYITINAALNSASAGDIINISSGTYNESLLINKPLTLIGSGKPIISGSGANYIIKIENATGIVLDNLEINGSGSVANPNYFEYGVLVSNAGTKDNPVEIRNSVIKNIWGASGNGVGVENKSYVLIHNNIFNLFQKNGIRFVDSEGKFYSNTVNGEIVDGINRVQNLLNLRSNSNVEINNNTLSNALTAVSSPDTIYSPCIFVNAYPDGLASRAFIYDNDISFCDVGIIVTTKLINGDNSSASIENNNFHDLYLGISFQQETGSVTMANNSFVNVTKISNRENPKTIETPKVIEKTPSAEVSSVKEEVKPVIEKTPVLEEAPVVEDPIVVPAQENELAASAGSAVNFGTTGNIVGILAGLFVLLLIGYLSKKYIK